MAVPKRRTSSSRIGKRRLNIKAVQDTIGMCLNCNTQKKTHFVCQTCGSYKKTQVIKVK